METDVLRTSLLQVPTAAIALSVLALAEASTGSRATGLLGSTFAILIAIPTVMSIAGLVNGKVLNNPAVLAADCPSCGQKIRCMEGGLRGDQDAILVKCDGCAARLRFEAPKRQAVLLP